MSRILVIDDSPLITQLLDEFLVSHGFEVVIAMDATDGYEKAISVAPDLILLDVKLPDVTGFDLLKILRNRDELRGVPVIMVTATAHTSPEKVLGFQQGADDYVLKPFDNEELLERIRLQLRKRSESQTPEFIPAPVSAAAIDDASPAVDPASPPLKQLISDVLFSPTRVPPVVQRHGVPAVFLLSMLGLTQGALALSAGPAVGPMMAALGVLAIWAAIVSLLVISASLTGLSLRWRDGAQLVSLAALPLVLKMLGAFLFSAWTTLSPFDFTASPVLFSDNVPAWLSRVDLFELWSYGLLGFLLGRMPKSSKGKAIALVVFIAVVVTASSLGMSRLGGRP